MFPPMAVSPTATWDTSLPGKWTYRSYANRADIIVNDDPEPAVRNLAAMFGEGSTANNAGKALSLIFGEGIMRFDPPSGNTVTGTFDMGGGCVLDLRRRVPPTSPWSCLPATSRAYFATRYSSTTYARYIGEYVLHCHILDHEDQGMMLNVEAVPNAESGVVTQAAAHGH